MHAANLGRLLLALAFFVGAAANTLMLLTAPEIYEGFADLSFLRLYRSLWRSLVLPRLPVWITFVIAFEVGVGVLLLAPDPLAHLGLILAVAFSAALVPFWWGGGALLNVLLLVGMLWLLRFDYGKSILSLLFGG